MPLASDLSSMTTISTPTSSQTSEAASVMSNTHSIYQYHECQLKAHSASAVKFVVNKFLLPGKMYGLIWGSLASVSSLKPR